MLTILVGMEADKTISLNSLFVDFESKVKEQFLRLESRIRDLETENKRLRMELGEDGVVVGVEFSRSDFEFLKIKEMYYDIFLDQHTIFESWIWQEIDIKALRRAGYVLFNSQNIVKAGTVNIWTHRSIYDGRVIYQQSPDHFHAVLQLAVYLMELGFDSVKINHWDDVDVSASYLGKSYAFEYERPGTHTVSDIRKKFRSAKEKYDYVYFICNAKNRQAMAKALEGGVLKARDLPANMCTRGKQLKFFIDCIVAENPIENCPVVENFGELSSEVLELLDL